MNLNYLESILIKNRGSFSEIDKRIADHFKKLDKEVINKTLANLSEETGISEGSFYKFVKKLGFSGFQDFKISVASNVHHVEDNNETLTAFTDISKSDSPYEIAQKVINSNKDSIDKLILSLEEEDLNNALDLLYEAETIHFFGQGASSIVAFDSYHKFHRSQFQCNYIFDPNIQLTYSTKLGPNDCVFLFSHSGRTIDTLEIGRLLNKNNVKIISMTGNPASELVSLSDVSFTVYSEESAFRSEALTARILYLTIIDILYVSVMYRDEKKNQQSLDNIRQAISITRLKENE